CTDRSASPPPRHGHHNRGCPHARRRDVTLLLDANVLIALVVQDHVHHDAAEDWLAGTTGAFASCPLTQGSLVRLLLREGQTVSTVTAVVQALIHHARHEFWADDISYSDVSMHGVVGHRQVRAPSRAPLARSAGAALPSFDKGRAKLHPGVVVFVPISPGPRRGRGLSCRYIANRSQTSTVDSPARAR